MLASSFLAGCKWAICEFSNHAETMSHPPGNEAYIVNMAKDGENPTFSVTLQFPTLRFLSYFVSGDKLFCISNIIYLKETIETKCDLTGKRRIVTQSHLLQLLECHLKIHLSIPCTVNLAFLRACFSL